MPECWSCEERYDDVPDANYCTNCAAPLSEFEPDAGQGFLSTRSVLYLKAMMEGKTEYLDPGSIDEALASSLKEQLNNDIRRAYVDIAVCRHATPDLFVKLGLLEFYESMDSDEVTPEMHGFSRLLSSVVDTLPAEMLDELRVDS